MKRLGISFLAVIAVLAMSFTVVSNEKAVKKSNLAPAITPCYTNVVLRTATPPPSPLLNLDVNLIQGSTPSAIASARAGQTYVPSSFSGAIDSEDCIGSDFFCCATITTRNGFNVVDAVFLQE